MVSRSVSLSGGANHLASMARTGSRSGFCIYICAHMCACAYSGPHTYTHMHIYVYVCLSLMGHLRRMPEDQSSNLKESERWRAWIKPMRPHHGEVSKQGHCGMHAASSPLARTVLVLEFFRKFWVRLCFTSWKSSATWLDSIRLDSGSH